MLSREVRGQSDAPPTKGGGRLSQLLGVGVWSCGRHLKSLMIQVLDGNVFSLRFLIFDKYICESCWEFCACVHSGGKCPSCLFMCIPFTSFIGDHILGTTFWPVSLKGLHNFQGKKVRQFGSVS